MARWNPTYKISLNDVFARNYSSKPVEIQRQLRKLIKDQTFKDVYSNSLIERIIERTQSGLDRNGKQFAFYSKSYTNSLEFKIYGKKRSDPNLTLTGEMLASLTQLKNMSPSTIYIGLIGENNKGKAQGHITGKLGRSNGPKRDFLGLPQKEEDSIFKSLLDDYANNSIDLNMFLDEKVLSVNINGVEIARNLGDVAGLYYGGE